MVALKRYVAGIAVLLSATAAFAPPCEARDERDYRPSYDKCQAEDEGITLKMLNCIGDEIIYQDDRLNQVYKRVIDRLPNDRKVVLRRQERRWILKRDRGCQRDMDRDEMGGGSFGQIIYNNCILAETVDRRIWLEKYPR